MSDEHREIPGRVAVVGAGTMGRGIAQAAAQAGCQVSLWDLSDDLLGRAAAGIEAVLRSGVDRGKVDESAARDALDRIATTTDLTEAASDADLIIEAVPEDPDIKRDVLRKLDAIAPPGAILASNTSSLSIASLAEATGRPGSVIGMHFFNPVHLMRLVEVVVSSHTEQATVQTTRALARAMGKTPITVSDSPGFASSRLGVVLGLEAMRMLEQNVASAEDIDRAMELGYNHPMGPLRLTDLVGLDVRLAIAEHLHRTLGGEQYRPPEILRSKVRDGKLGKKTGEGFYRWEE